MNEGRQITKEQAEACMRADAEFAMKGNRTSNSYSYRDGSLYCTDEGLPKRYCCDGLNDICWGRILTIHADPNNTFERLFGSGELTFEEVGAALFRGETVHCDTGKLQ